MCPVFKFWSSIPPVILTCTINRTLPSSTVYNALVDQLVPVLENLLIFSCVIFYRYCRIANFFDIVDTQPILVHTRQKICNEKQLRVHFWRNCGGSQSEGEGRFKEYILPASLQVLKIGPIAVSFVEKDR